MARLLAKSPGVLTALGLWILLCPALLAQDDDPNALNQQVNQLIVQGKYQEAIPIAERAIEVSKRVRGPEQPETAAALNNLGAPRISGKEPGDHPRASSQSANNTRKRSGSERKVLNSDPERASSRDIPTAEAPQ